MTREAGNYANTSARERDCALRTARASRALKTGAPGVFALARLQTTQTQGSDEAQARAPARCVGCVGGDTVGSSPLYVSIFKHTLNLKFRWDCLGEENHTRRRREFLRSHSALSLFFKRRTHAGLTRAPSIARRRGASLVARGPARPRPLLRLRLGRLRPRLRGGRGGGGPGGVVVVLAGRARDCHLFCEDRQRV